MKENTTLKAPTAPLLTEGQHTKKTNEEGAVEELEI